MLNPLSPIVTNINFLLTISVCCQEKWLWELIKWSPKKKCFDLLSNSLHYFLKEMYEGQYREFICGYQGLNGLICVFSFTAYGNNTTKDNTSENFFCDVCSKKLNGPIPYKMHLNSKAHKEEVALKEEFGYWWLLYQTDIFLTYNAKDSTVCTSVQIWEKFPLVSSSGPSCSNGG